MSTEPSAQHAEMTPAKRTTDQIPTNAREQIGERLFNFAITHIPSHTIRQSWLRFFGMKIGKNTSIMMGTRVHGIQQLTVGNNCSIGFRCLLDARGELTIDDDVVLASDVHIVAGHHLVNSDDFGRFLSPIHIKHHVWVASRSTILAGVELGVGAVVGACSLVRKDVADMEIVAGVPAKHVGVRRSSLDYHPIFRPLMY
ncbi:MULTISPECIES: acyltransferase [Nocardiaceae]|jgi:putative colanic acid biosynthesis acetyltransferase WcaF|uniref:acyltransferase n=2 Tax=Mycobacteriales TaxID=85007 RepID=UPI0022B16594|nr:acyltransferase [Rhodococcus yunnanensis]MCZ4277638.1 acyltransferase [Rhodococcus yunnanensis]